jgi:integrase
MWNPNELSRVFSRMARAKSPPPLRLHDLRQGFATLAFAAGVLLKVVSESLGHASLAVTSNIYVRILDEAKCEKSPRLDAYVGDAIREAISKE